MKSCNALENQTIHRILLIACATALAVVFTVSLSQPAHADQVTPPPVPDNLELPAGATAFLVGHAVGTQNYICLPCPNPITPAAMCPPSGFAFGLFTPQATLFDDHGKQIITHYFSPNLAPDQGEIAGTIRATWQTSDTSIVWAKATAAATHASDPDFVAEGAVAWLTLARVGAQDGPRGEDTLGDTTFVQRLNTSGGLATPSDCASLADVGKEAFVPYTADYFFYKGPESDADDGK